MRNPASFCAAKSKSSKKPNRATNDQKATRAASRPAHFFSQGKAAFLFILLFAGCAQYAAVSEKRPRFTPVRSTADALVQIQQGIAEALKKQSRDPMAALGSYLASADAAARELARNPQNDTARSDYNFAVARIISTIRTESSIRGRNRCACRLRAATMCSITAGIGARRGIPRSTGSPRRTNSA